MQKMLGQKLRESIPKLEKFPNIICICCNAKDQLDSKNTEENENQESYGEKKKQTPDENIRKRAVEEQSRV